MKDDFTLLSSAWMYWNGLARIPNASFSRDCGDCLVKFSSDAESFHLRKEGEWWVVDVIDDRGKRYNDTCRFSSFELVEKYFIWNWASFARSSIGLEALGPNLYKQGLNPAVIVNPTENRWRSEVVTPDGSAILAEPELTIFTYLASKPLRDIEEMVRSGID